MVMRRKGFTLIELLVVIAIIGILAAMVFPVFARARESARKVVCLSNVKNIALAIQMYLGDNNDTLPPDEQRQEVLDYFVTWPGGSEPGGLDPGETAGLWCAPYSNPYLRWPVIFDEYTKNRDVWRCPSAKIASGASWIIPGPDWLSSIKAGEGSWGLAGDYLAGGACYYAWPPGWGGDVTDTLLQERLAVPLYGLGGGEANKAFVTGIGTTGWPGMKLVEVQDVANFVIAGDAGTVAEDMFLGNLAYPDICMMECANPICGWADWEGCASYGASCGLYGYAPNDGSFLANPELRKQYSRHLGGVNLGFLDGHATWINSTSLINKVIEGDIGGVKTRGANSEACEFSDYYPGVPTLY